MKKSLSLILAIAMVLTLIPTTFAEDTETTSTVGENIQIVYSFKQTDYSGAANEEGKYPDDVIKYLNSGGRVEFLKSTYTNSSGAPADPPGKWNGGYPNITTNSGAYVAFKINVPKAGAYAVKYEHLNRSSSSSKTPQTDVYIIPYTEDISAAISAATALFTTNAVTDTSGEGTELIADTGSFTAAQAGEHLLVIKATGTACIRPAKLTLTLGDGSEKAVMGTTEETLAVGGTTTIKGYDSTVAKATELTDLTYATSNASVAEVSEDGTVTAKGIGAATITTSAEGCYPLTTTITVTDPTKPVIRYDLAQVMKDKSMSYISNSLADTTTRSPLNTIDYASTSGKFKTLAGSGNLTEYNKTVQSDYLIYRGNYMRFTHSNDWIAFEIEVPVSGEYLFEAEHPLATTKGRTEVAIYTAQDYTNKINRQYIGQFSTYGGTADLVSNMPLTATIFEDKSLTLSAGKHVVVFSAKDTSSSVFSSFSLISGTGDALLGYLDSDTTLEIGESATLKGFLSASGESADVTYLSSNDCVTVDADGTIKAVKPGEATVTMTADAATATAGNTYAVDITVPDKAASDTVAYGTNINGEIKVEGTGIKRGTDVTVTAPEISGKIFRHWVLGTVENGTVVWTEAEYKFPLMTNTYLTAVYTDEPAEGAKLVEFFNWNGDYLSQSVLGENNSYTAPSPSLIGFSFNNKWLVDEEKYLSDVTEFGSVTRAVAEFTPVGNYTVDGTSYTYDDDVTKTADSEMAWYRDDVLVGYGKEYTYNVWNNVGNITSTPIATKKPVVVLDAHIKDGNACMIEYDNGGKTIKEVGILFGTADATVDSADSKATSQWNEAHGQFTAKPRTAGNATHARGYLIYADGEDFRVIYTDAIALASAD